MVPINLLYLILFALCAIIPALIVYVVLSTRIQMVKGDAAVLETKTNAKLQSVAVLEETITALTGNCTDAATEAHKAGLRVLNLEESLSQLSNKLAARERDRKRAENKRRKEEEEEPDDYGEIPGTEQQIMDIPGAIPLEPRPAEVPTGRNIIKSTRKFGTVPR